MEFILNSLKEIDQLLKKRGSKLLMLYGKPENLIPELCKKWNLSAVFANEDYEPYAKKRDAQVKKKLGSSPFYCVKDHVIFSEVLKKDGSAYRMFNPYKKAWLDKLSSSPQAVKTGKPPDLKKLIPKTDKIFKEHPPDFLKSWKFQNLPILSGESSASGEVSAQKQLQRFSQQIHEYHEKRNYPFENKGSQLSVHLRFGTISIRNCVRMALKYKNEGAQIWLSELVWREFYSMVLNTFGKEALKKSQRNKPSKHFKAWSEGQTGFPIVDAGMRQLNQTGLMHNRLRMITANFLIKDLLIDWRKGEAYFAEKLLDFDLASNNGGWQWCAGTGFSAQPWFRVFNPVLQSQKFDPKGLYIKTWVPELKKLSPKQIHFPKDHQKDLPIQLGKDYPLPIVNHKIQKEKFLKKFKSF